jgi:hypothetical protein
MSFSMWYSRFWEGFHRTPWSGSSASGCHGFQIYWY